jgi:hypothetical protein
MAGPDFHLDKWFLDFIGQGGETMIFYAATLTWKGYTVRYGSWLNSDPGNGVRERSHIRHVNFPERTDNLICWHDDQFSVSGRWESAATPLHARLFDADEGYLDWFCHQPASRVRLNIGDRVLNGDGYVEQLILTAPPWHIPLDDLRWGRFRSANDTMVWIEIRSETKRQWVWLNSEQVAECRIEDDLIAPVDGHFLLKLDRGRSLESGVKIYRVMRNLLRYLPGFGQKLPGRLLMANNQKWVSKGEFQRNGGPASRGAAIHEWVNFNAHPS